MTIEREAFEIADDFLYQTGKGLRTGDFDIFFDCFSVPYLLETPDTKRTISSKEEFRGVFDNVRRVLVACIQVFG